MSTAGICAFVVLSSSNVSQWHTTSTQFEYESTLVSIYVFGEHI
jgi:hypothetical protein